MFESQRKVTFENPDLLGHERKFDTAIRKSTVLSFKERIVNQSTTIDDQLILGSNLFEADIDELSYDTTIMAVLLERVLTYKTKFPITLVKLRKGDYKFSDPIHIMNLIKDSTLLQLRNMNKQNMLPNVPSFLANANKFLDIDECPKEILHLTKAVTEAAHLVEKTKHVFKYRFYQDMDEDKKNEYLTEIYKNNTFNWEAIGMTFVWSRNLVYIHDHLRDLKCVLPRPYIQMIHNKLADLLSVLTLVFYGSQSIYQPNAYEITIDFIKDMIQLNKKYKNKFYTIIKTLEGFVNGEHMNMHDSWRNIAFLINTSEDLEESTGFDYLSSSLRITLLRGNTVLRNELGCLSKILGHPLVDMEKGAQSLYSKVNDESIIDPVAVQDLINCAKRDYINSFLAKHGKWPNISFKAHPGEILLTAWKLNCPLYSTRLPHHLQTEPSLDQYVNIELGQDMRFTHIENFIPYLKDKTISLLKDDIIKQYFEEDPDYSTNWKQTRLLLYFLLNTKYETDHVSYIDKYMASEDLEDLMNFLLIKIVPKEKELKELFRGFGCKTYMERSRALIQEKNAMRFLDLYSSEQVMTSTELEIEHKLHAFRNLHKAYTNHTILYISIDASSWNNRFRSNTVDAVHKEYLDKIFGISLFGKTHLAFEKSLIYIPDENGVYSWQGQLGGIEGLNQDTWVTIYLPMIHAALRNCQYKYYLLCKGDDMRVALIIPPKALKGTSIKVIQRDILSQISSFLKKVGHVVKIDECYGSQSLFAFSKNPSVNGICLPQGFRKIMKAYGANNALLCTLDDNISSTLSNAHSAARVLPTPLPAYCVGLFWFYYYLSIAPEYKDLTYDQLLACSLIPSAVGGFPLIYLHNFYVRAEADLLPAFFDLYSYLRKVRRPLADVMMNFMEVQDRVPDNISGLCSDIYSLPTYMPQLPTTKLRSLISPVLRRITKNETIKELINLALSEEVQDCKRVLGSAKYYIMKPIQIISEALPDDILKRFIRKFESARSIIDVIYKGMPKQKASRLLRDVLHQEIKLQKWRSSRLRGSHGILGRLYHQLIKGECPMADADRVREYSWGKPLIGVTMAPIVHTMIFGTRYQFHHDPHCTANHFTYHLNTDDEVKFLSSKRLDNNRSWALGKYKPFLGYKTSAGTIAPSIHFIDKDDILTTLKNLIELVHWYDKEILDESGNTSMSNIRPLVSKVLKLYTKQEIQDLSPFVGTRKSGTPEHHLPSSSFMRSIVPNCLPNIYTQISGVSNSHTMFASSLKYKLNMLHLMCGSYSIMTQELGVSRRITTPAEVWGATINCDGCMKPIRDELLIFDDTLISRLKIPSLSQVKIGEVSLEILKESLTEFQKKEKFTYVDPLPGDTDISSYAIIQIYLEQHFKDNASVSAQSKKELHTAGTHKIMRPLQIANVTKTIGKTELKRALLDPMIYSLSQYIYNYILYSKNHTMRHAPLDKLVTPFLDQIRTFPWYKLFLDFLEIGRLQEFMSRLAKLASCPDDAPVNIDNTIAVATQLCIIIHMRQTPKRIPLTLTYISDMALTGRKGLVLQYLQNLKWCILRSESLDPLNPILRKTRSIDCDFFMESIETFMREEDLDEYMQNDEITNDDLVNHIYPVCYLLLGLTIACSKIHLLKDADLENILSQEGVKLSDLIHIDLPDIADLGLEEVQLRSGSLYRSIMDYVNIEDDVIDGILYSLQHEGLISHVVFRTLRQAVLIKMSEMIIPIRFLSKVQCIETVRSIQDTRVVTRSAKNKSVLNDTSQFSFIARTKIGKSSKVLPLDLKFISTGILQYRISPADSSLYVTPSYANLVRPTGLMTGTYSILTELFYTLKLTTGLSNMTIVAIGVGAGSDLIFLSQAYPNSSFWILTKPPKGQIHYDASIVESFVQKDDLGDYHTDHIRQGMYDAADLATWQYLRSSMGNEMRDSITNLIWCDIDYSHTDASYVDILDNILDHFIYYSSKRCMIICKVDITREDTLRFLYILRTTSRNLYLVRPLSMINCRYVYVVAIDRSEERFLFGSKGSKKIKNAIPLSANVYEEIDTWVKIHIHTPTTARHNIKNYTISSDNYLKQLVYPQEYINRFDCSPLFISLLRHRLSMIIDNTMLEKMLLPKTKLSPIPTHYHYDNLVIDYGRRVKQYARDLGEYDGRALIINNTQAHRVYVIRCYMRLMGFKLVHDIARQNEPFDLNFKTIKEMFWEHYIRLSPRDRDVNGQPTTNIFKFHYQELGVENEYFIHFIKGVNIGLTMVAYINYRYPGFVRGKVTKRDTTEHIFLGEKNHIWNLNDDDMIMHPNIIIPDHDNSLDSGDEPI